LPEIAGDFGVQPIFGICGSDPDVPSVRVADQQMRRGNSEFVVNSTAPAEDGDIRPVGRFFKPSVLSQR
jgi:hypothetical protein